MLIVTIKKDQDGEYRVPSPDDTEEGSYYTDDKEDAIATCRIMHGDCLIKFRSVRQH